MAQYQKHRKKGLIDERKVIKHFEEGSFVVNDLNRILDAIYNVYEQQLEIVIVADEPDKAQIKIAAEKLGAKLINSQVRKFPSNAGIVLVLDTIINGYLLRDAQNKHIEIIGSKELMSSLREIKVQFYCLPSFGNNTQYNIQRNLQSLPIAFNSVKNIYFKNIEQERKELIEIASRLSDANSRANKALDEALAEIKETKLLFDNLGIN